MSKSHCFSKLFVILLLLIALGTATAQEPQYGGTLVFGAESMGDSFDIGFWHGFGGVHVIDTIGEGLVRADFENGGALPGLAESWEISDDGLTYTFHIRDGMTFHDGEPVTAGAIVRSMTRPISPDDPSYIDGMYMYGNQGTSNWESIDAVDDSTIVLQLMQPNATQLLVFSRPDGAIISPKAMDEYGTEVGLNMSMAGPYKIERFVPGQEAVLSANEDYWAGRPYIDQIVIRAYPDEAAILAALEAGEIDMTLYAPFTSVPRLQDSENIRVEVGAPLVDLFVGANVAKEPFDNLLLRQAVNYALDRETLIEAGLNGFAEMPASLLGPLDLGFDEAGREVSVYDPERAKELLAESGMDLPVAIEVAYENNRFWPQMAELIAADLEAVGFDVTLDRLDAGSFWGKVGDGQTQLSINQRSTFVPDPHDKAILMARAGAEGSQTQHQALEAADAIDALVTAGVSTVDSMEREAIYREFQALMLEQLPYIYIGYLTPPIFVSKRVQNVETFGTAGGRINLREVWLSE
ncbi:MAG: ABC transporter substrate-binding protein [Chloroflexota bacterium]|nr:ABC transporter substrate-binding protein [Chloroflexota bacterium]